MFVVNIFCNLQNVWLSWLTSLKRVTFLDFMVYHYYKYLLICVNIQRFSRQKCLAIITKHISWSWQTPDFLIQLSFFHLDVILRIYAWISVRIILYRPFILKWTICSLCIDETYNFHSTVILNTGHRVHGNYCCRSKCLHLCMCCIINVIMLLNRKVLQTQPNTWSTTLA